MTTFAPETQFGKYRIIRLLGQGGMADVYEAEDTAIGRVVALKILPLAFARDQERAGRFAKEIQASAALDHPNIVSVFEVGEIDDLHYYTMSVLPGGDLKARLKTGALSQKEALRITREIASALNYAHDKGFVHRDVKPENILFRQDGSAVLTDFGIARAMGTGTRMTATGLSIGTPHYMSPEQARGLEIDGRSDLYALGVVFHEMLTGKVPFDAQDSFAVGLMHINDAPPELPPRLGRFQPILDKLLAKEPDDRYQSGAELVADLDRLEKGEAIEPPRRATRMIKRTDHGITESRNHGSSGSDGSRSGLYWALGGAALALVLAAGIYLWQDQSSPMPPIGGGSTTASRSAPAESAGATPQPGTRNPKTERWNPQPVSSERAPSEPALSNRDLTGNAILHIETTPEGAEVFLNDEAIGTTPFQSDSLPAGEHRLRLVSRYFEPWEQTVRLEDDVVDRIEAELQRGRGRVTVITDPPGAEVWIDGQPHYGTTPVTLSGLTSGDQSLEIRLPRYRTITRTVEILPGDTARLDLALEGGDLHEWEGRWLTGDEVIPLLLEAAEADLAARRLMAPEGDNAWEQYRRVLDIDPGNEDARTGIERIVARYAELAEGALVAGELDRAEAFLGRMGRLGARSDAYAKLENQLQIVKDERRVKREREQQRFQAVLRERRLIRGIQTELARLGREVSITGELDTSTTELIRVFERAIGVPETGEATNSLLGALRLSARWPVSPQPGDVFRDCPACPEMVVIPAGIFTMGSPETEPQRAGRFKVGGEWPQQRVAVQAFAMSETEVTFGQWSACVAGGACRQVRPLGSSRGNLPVSGVSWNSAQQYVSWISRETGETYRLPSEAEWEYAARAGTSARFHTGDCITTAQANFDGHRPARGCPSGQDRGRPLPVGSFAPNAFGLHDMHGNVTEWVQDCNNRNYKDAHADSSARMSGDCDRAMQRGGSWDSFGKDVRSAARESGARQSAYFVAGFRVARELSQ